MHGSTFSPPTLFYYAHPRQKERETMPNQSKERYEMKGQYTPENSALVLIDHQVGTLTFVHNIPSDDCLRNAIMLAKAAKAYVMPVVLSTSQEDHVQWPTAPAFQEA